jgi:hypothetical protein
MRKLFRRWWFWLIVGLVPIQVFYLRHSLHDYQVEQREEEWRNRAIQATTEKFSQHDAEEWFRQNGFQPIATGLQYESGFGLQ